MILKEATREQQFLKAKNMIKMKNNIPVIAKDQI